MQNLLHRTSKKPAVSRLVRHFPLYSHMNFKVVLPNLHAWTRLDGGALMTHPLIFNRGCLWEKSKPIHLSTCFPHPITEYPDLCLFLFLWYQRKGYSKRVLPMWATYPPHFILPLWSCPRKGACFFFSTITFFVTPPEGSTFIPILPVPQ